MGTVSIARFCAVGASQVMSAVCRTPAKPRAELTVTRTGRYVPGLTQMVSETGLFRAASQLDRLDSVDPLPAQLR